MEDLNKTVAMKMGIKQNMRAYFQSPNQTAIQNMALPPLTTAAELEGDFDYIHFFVKNQAEFHQYFPHLKAHLKQTGMLWVSWPKSSQLGTDLTIKEVIRLGYEYGLVESKALSINDIWSALKFTHPKKDKIYNNRYGKLGLHGKS